MNSTMKLMKLSQIKSSYTIIVKENYTYNLFSRIFDIVFALVLGIFTLPIVVLAVIFIKLEDQGPAFYSQERLGKDGEIFLVYKLRSMRKDAEKFGIQWAEKNDPRITKVGRFIRLTRIDEIPQILNMFNGSMKLIGPRPERPELTLQFNEETPGFINRLAVKPGLTGWAQVNGGYEISPAEKVELDVHYIKNRSLAMDIEIIFKTVKVVLTGEGAR